MFIIPWIMVWRKDETGKALNLISRSRAFLPLVVQVAAGGLTIEGVHQNGQTRKLGRDDSRGHENPALLSERVQLLLTLDEVLPLVRDGLVPTLLRLIGTRRRGNASSGARAAGSRSSNRGRSRVRTGTGARGGGSAELVTHVILLLKL
jgi:hypothetical protein